MSDEKPDSVEFKRLQFRLSTMLVLAVVIAIAIACLNQLWLNDPGRFFQVAVLVMVFSGGLVFRLVGAWLGRRIGPAGYYYSLTWFATTLGAAIVILAITAVVSPRSFVRDVQDGAGVASLLFGLMVGTVVELGILMLKASRRGTYF